MSMEYEEPQKSPAVAIVIAVFLAGLILCAVFLVFLAFSKSQRTESVMLAHADSAGTPLVYHDTVDENFDDRLKAARLITTSETMNEAFADIAKDAARVGETKIVRQAIASITSIELRDKTASDSATLLAGSGNSSGGIEIANLISTRKLRNDTLAKIAKSDY